MWANLNDELRSIPLPEDEVVDMPPQAELYRTKPEENDMLLGTPTKVNITALHPDPTQISRLWQIFLTNVNPLTHLIHPPTMQQSISDACELAMHGIPRGIEAFMFAMYLSAVNSLTEAECLPIFGESKEALMMRYWFGTRQSLINSLWLRSSELMVLQAFVLFLLSVRQLYDPRTLWSLTGVALRIGQRIGIHRDGASLGLPALDTELRRRLWWQTLVLDGRMAELSGSGFSVLASLSDTKLPLNVNNTDLQPGVIEPPAEHTGATEMMFCLLRYEFGAFFTRAKLGPRGPTNAFDGVWQALTTSETSITQRDQTINELQEILESKFLRFCDPLNPLHFLTGALARSALATMRFKVHHPRGRRGQKLPTEELDMLFTSSLRIIEYDNIGHSTQSIQRFLWHIKSHFAWDPFIYLLTELRRRVTGDEVDRAWQQVEEAYHHHGEFLTMRSPLHDSVATLAERAWGVREAELARRQRIPQTSVLPANFITVLRSRRLIPVRQTSTENTSESYQIIDHPTSEQQPPDYNNGDVDQQYPSEPVELSPIDWAAWDIMIEEFELNAGGSLY
jgi:Fungal specific transcription factor domain